jgi:iron complex outermembrane receptor protein
MNPNLFAKSLLLIILLPISDRITKCTAQTILTQLIPLQIKQLSSLGLFLTCICTSFTAHSQQVMPSIQMDSTIVVLGRRIQIPFSAQNRNIAVLDKAQIQSIPARSVSELLSYVSGVDVRRRGVRGAQEDISLNGGTFDQTLILLNGIKIIDPQTGHNMMNLPVSLDAIQRIEILKGPAASAYGVNAINGAVNIITRQPKKTEGTVHAYSGSSFKENNHSSKLYSNLGVGATASLANKNSDHLISLSTIQSNGYRYNTPVKNDKIFYSNKINIGNGNLNMMGGVVRNNFGANGFYSAPKDKDSQEAIQTAIAAVNGHFKVTDFWYMHPSVGYRHNYDDYILDRKHPEVYENRHFTNAVDATLKNSFYTLAGTFGLGMEYRNAGINSSNLGDHHRTNLGFFGKYSLNMVPNLLVNAGLYINYNNKLGWNWMPSINTGYQISDNFRLFANAGTGLRLPTYTDLYYKGPVNIGNDELQPEKAWQVTSGIKYNKAKFNASASYFYRNTSDFIDWVKNQVSDPWHTRNYQNIKTQGISFSGNYRILNRTSSGYGLLLGLSYTWLHPKLTKGKKAHVQGKISHYALENLRNQLAVHINTTFMNRFGITLGGKYQQRVNYKDYFLLAARVSAKVSNFQFYIDASNLLNVQFIEAGAVPMPGSWFTLGAKWHWQK